MGEGDNSLLDFRARQADYWMTMERLEEKDTIEYYIHALPEVHSERTAILWRGSYRMESYTYHDIHDLSLIHI